MSRMSQLQNPPTTGLPTASFQAIKMQVPHRSGFDFEDFFENGTVALHLVGGDGTILHANKAELELLGYEPEEYIGRNIRQFHADQLVIADILGCLQRGERLHKYPARLLAKDGSIKDAEITSSALFKDGEFINTRCFTVDVTDLKRARDELRRKDEQFRQVLEALPAAVYTTDAAGKITYYNRAASDLAGRQPTIGKDEWCVTFRLFTPDGKVLPHDQCPMAVSLRENRPVRGVEAMAQRPDGTLFPFLPFPTPLLGDDGEIVGAVNMLVDISDRKEAETHQRMLLDELNHRVKNNLQMVCSLLNAAQRESQNEEARALLAEVAQRISAMSAAQQLLYNDNNPRGFSMSEFLHAVCDSTRQLFGPEVKITIDADRAHLPNEVAMPLALIVNELLTNAAKYGKDKDGQVNVDVSLKRRDRTVKLCVSDEGPGFEIRTSCRSSGLGLVAGLARQLLGSFSVDRASGARCIVEFSAQH
jgi:PAS domain S-box-containing protein